MRILMELWPALLPLLFYVAWMALKRDRARKRGEEKPGWKEGPLFWAVLASIGVMIACLFLLGLSADPVTGHYVPQRLEEGRIVPGRIEP